MTWLKKLLAAIWAALTTPAPSSEGGGSSPPIEPDNPVPIPPDDGGGAGVPPWGPDNPDPNDEDKGGYDHSSLWKPVSESDGKLAVIVGYPLPLETIQIGPHTARNLGTNNGHRRHFRFPWPGKKYGDGVTLIGVDDQGQRWTATAKAGARRNALVWRRVR